MLYVCGTPIGNLSDITPRLIETLNLVDLIICEDTRHSIKLLNHLNISKKLISYHQHNEFKKVDYIIDLLKEGNKIALLSDAGMPVISDPGAILVKKVIENNITIIPISGPSAFILALIGSGFDIEPFIFYGFIDRDKQKKDNFFKDIKEQNKAIVIYESPFKLIKTLKEVLEKIDDIEVCIARELTKRFEEFWRGKISDAITYFSEKEIKGEFCIVFQPYQKKEEITQNTIELFAKSLLLQGLHKKEAGKIMAEKYNIKSSDAYKILLDLS